MSEQPSRTKAAIVTFFPMFIAALSLLTSIYNGHLNSKFVDLIQSNIGRVEYLKTCKEAIDAYFQVKLRTDALLAGQQSGATRDDFEARAAASRFAALGTYLANLRNEAVRARYTELSDELNRVVGKARAGTTTTTAAALFERADRIFSDMNDDCVMSAKAAPLK